MDALTEIHAPFEGEVKTLTTPLTYYRMHGSERFSTYQLDVERFYKAVAGFRPEIGVSGTIPHTRGINF